MVARGVVEESDDEPGVQQLKISLLKDEGKASVERFQNYGFSSNPPVDTEVLCVFVGGGRDHGVIVATDDRDSRFTDLKPGEIAIYTDEGDSIVFKRENEIEITSGKKFVLHTEEEIEIKAKDTILKLIEDGIEIEATTMKVKGNIEIDGNLNATGSINAPGGSVGP